jgi:hypothetical protein
VVAVTKRQIATLLVGVMNDLHKRGVLVREVRAFGVRAKVEPWQEELMRRMEAEVAAKRRMIQRPR